MEPVETYPLKNGRVLEIHYDEDASDPRKEFDNLGTMICFHRRYSLGDDHNYDSNDFDGWNAIEARIRKDNDVAVILPLYLYDHSGITMNTTGFHCPWDSGQVGFIFIAKDKVRYEYSVKRISRKLRERVAGYLRSEVETYDQFISGQVYGYVVREAPTVDEDGDEIEGDEVDSCWGFYGSDPKVNGIADHVPELVS
jgi:hypothetical protein